jgi:hypothetical protein
MRNGLLAFSIAVFAATASFASQEQYLGWSEVRIVSAGVEDTGEVSFVASVSNSGEWKRVEVSAFGKKFTLDEKQRTALKEYPAFSIVNTYEPGYEQLGGHTVHWKFKRLYREGDRLMEREVVVSISKGKCLEIREWDGKPAER